MDQQQGQKQPLSDPHDLVYLSGIGLVTQYLAHYLNY